MKDLRFIFLLFLGMSSCGNNQIDTIKTETKILPIDSVTKKDSIVEIKKEIYTIDSTKKYIYLTFDDGPQNGTLACYEICKELNVKGTFFMISVQMYDKWGKNLAAKVKTGYPTTLLANHSHTHAFRNQFNKFYHQPNEAFLDFKRANDSLKADYKMARLPGNNGWATKRGITSSKFVRNVITKLDSAGYDVLGWDIEWHFSYDGKSKPVESTQSIIQQIKYALQYNSYSKNHVVLLMHDRMFKDKSDADSLRFVIQELKKNNNYVFETLDHYPNIKLNRSN